MSIREDFRQRIAPLDHAGSMELTPRLIGAVEWMQEQQAIRAILDELRQGRGSDLVDRGAREPYPGGRSLEDIASTGLALADRCRQQKQDLWNVALEAGFHSIGSSGSFEPQDMALKGYIEPFLDYVLRRLPNDEPLRSPEAKQITPVAIQDSLRDFEQKHPDPRKVAFVMMQFGKTSAHGAIEQAIKETLKRSGLTAILARDKQYLDELYPNIQTYMHGCGFGIAIFERIETDDFNPNVSLEVGYMLGLKKPVLLLKDQTLRQLPSDLVGKLYKPFDPLHPAETLAPEIEQWMEDKGFI